MTHTGVVERIDLGAGGYALVLSDNTRLTLDGEIPEHLVGQRVVVKGSITEVSGFLMTGDRVLMVEAIRPA